jgi:DNA topoisomerase VI subunit B
MKKTKQPKQLKAVHIPLDAAEVERAIRDNIRNLKYELKELRTNQKSHEKSFKCHHTLDEVQQALEDAFYLHGLEIEIQDTTDSISMYEDLLTYRVGPT